MIDDLNATVTLLGQIAVQQGLVQRAEAGCRQYLINCSAEEGLPRSWKPENIRSAYRSSSLCFRSYLLSYPYITTTLDLFVGKDEVGDYRLITTLNGEDDDDYLVFNQHTISGAIE